MAYEDFKDLKRAFSDKVLKDKPFNIAINRKYDGYQRGLASMVYKFFDKKSKGSGIANNEIKQNLQLAKELHKPIIRNFKKRTVYSGFKDNIWGVDLADMQSPSKYNKGIKYLLCAIDVFSKYVWVVPIKDKKGVSIVDVFQEILKESNWIEANSKGRKPNKIWVDKGSQFYNNSFKKGLKDNDIEMHSIHNKEKSAVAERFIRTLKSKIFKHMTAISKNVYFDVLDDIVNKYNNTVHRTIKMKPIDVKDNTYADSKKEVNDKISKFKVGDPLRISKYKNICAKRYTPTWPENFFIVNKNKITVPWTYVINNLNREEIIGTFFEKELQKTNQKEFGIEKVIKRKDDKLL